MHKHDCSDEKRVQYNYNIYKFIRSNNGFENFDLIQIEKYNAIDKHDLHSRERFWIEELKATLNKQIPTRTLSEYYQNNKKKLQEDHKNYYEVNKDKIKERYDINKDKIKERQKRYREKTKDKMKEYHKQYCIDKKDKIKERHKRYYEEKKRDLVK